ncbi:hypothetical protein K458DRAFT_398082 [Lentithecium fluviatile CBS 122367]|uniref:Uncharacterized protein n=1 Tax=Lentithecium fluviatile CBS 122367 TaxID=1168545 RepID=A0A6G1JM58_9PLEO|nr:hypothetical protein K458DRAFT_398082 [Lentithecium fluviatile CBS 122367]
MKDFVYSKNAGENKFAYVIDDGIQIDVKNDEKIDEDPSSHGTKEASKALGRRHGVQYVASAGNETKTPGRENIDTLPKACEDKYTPIINVGAAISEGSQADFSQAGSKLTLYAPGRVVEAAPAVAGIIATYLSLDQSPWDGSKTGKDRVQAIKDHIPTDGSSWIRKQGSNVRMIWKGATEADHNSVGAHKCDDSSKKRGLCPGSPSSQPSASAQPALYANRTI